MRSSKRLLFSTAIAVLSLCATCGHKEKNAATIAERLSRKLDLSTVVAARPAKIVSVLATIDLEFNTEMVPSHLVGVVLDKSPFEFGPAIDGHAEWLSTAAVRFTPSKPLKPGQEYKCVFKGKTAFGPQKNVDDYAFSFKAAEQEVIDVTGDFNPDLSGKDLVRFEGVLRFAQAVAVDEVKKDLRLKNGKNNVDFVLAASGDGAGLKLTSAPMQRGAALQTFVISLPEKYTVNAGEWRREFMLPGRNVFKVISGMEMTDPKDNALAWGLRFSDPIKPDMDLSGFVSVEPDVKYAVRVQGKTLKLRGEFAPGVSYTVTVAKGFPCAFGTVLASPYTAEFVFDNKPPKVEWLSKGVLLPPDNNSKIQLKTMNVKKIRVEVSEIFSENLGFFLQTNNAWETNRANRGGDEEYEYGEDGYSYGRPSFPDEERVGAQIAAKEYDLLPKRNQWFKTEIDIGKLIGQKRNAGFIVKVSFGRNDLIAPPTNSRDSAADFLYYDGGSGYYRNPAGDGYYYGNGNAQKLLVASDIALTIKKAMNGWHVFATDVISSSPASGLELQLCSYQNQVMDRATTDAGGYAFFNETEGFCIKGKNGNGLAFIQLNHPRWEMNTFDVGGISDGQNNINAFLYTDRGVHRPGDTIFLGAIIRIDRRPPPRDQPIMLTVENSRGQTVHTAKTTGGANGHVVFAIPTSPDDPTGSWVARVTMAKETFDRTLKVETVKPNRLKVKIDLPEHLAGSNGSVPYKGVIESKYLFGAPAAGLKYRIKAYLEASPKSFPKLSGYVFGDPQKKFRGQDQTIAEDAELNGSGSAAFQGAFSDLGRVPEAVVARLDVSVFENGGGFTETWKTVEADPYSVYVGIKNPLRWNSARTGEEYTLPIVAVDTAGSPVKGRKLIVREYVNRHYWWWDYDNEDRKDFRTLAATYLVDEQTLFSGNDGRVSYSFKVEDYGQHFIEVSDPQGGHAAGMFFYGSEWGGGAAADEEAPQGALLEIHSDRNVYQPGEEATLTFKSPAAGHALLTVEQGTRLLKKQWVEVTGAETKVKFTVENDYVPNCYATISMVQPHAQAKNDLPMRLYGVKNLQVENAATRLPIEMTAPKELAPRQKFSVRVASNAPEAATFTIAIVDEGLLDLTNFDTPDPWAHFFRKYGLFVESFDNFSDVIGALLPDMDAYFSIGGSMMEEKRKQRLGGEKGKRFPPVVLFSRPLDIDPGKSVSVDFTMPNYVGSVRCMLVASSGHSYAAREQTIPVKQALMVLPTLPRVLRPLDQVKLPVTVFSMDPKIRRVEVGVSAPPSMVEIKGPSTVQVSFDAPGEKDVTFDLAVKSAIGPAAIRVTASSDGFSTYDETAMTVGPANPFYTDVTDAIATKGKPAQLVPRPVGLQNRATLSLRRLPNIDIQQELAYLIHYPYGCIEQTTSSVFPQLYLANLLDLRADQKQAITDAVNAGIARLELFKLGGSNGFSFWPSGDYGKQEFSDWGTSYAGHFLVEARKLGYNVPDDLFDHWVSSQQRNAAAVNTANHRLQAYRIFTLALAGKPHFGGMNLMRENYLNDLDPLSKQLLAAAYYLGGKKDIAEQIRQNVKTELTHYREMDGSYGSDLRDLGLLAYAAVRTDDQTHAAKLVVELANRFHANYWYSTQESAFALLAIGTVFSSLNAPGGAVDYTVTLPGGKTERGVLKGCMMQFPLGEAWGKPVTVSTGGDNPLFVSVMSEGVPLESRITTGADGLELTRNLYDDDGRPMSMDNVEQGKPFWIHYRVTNVYGSELRSLALSSLFPSGWEIMNLRVDDAALPEWAQQMNASTGDYQDIRDDRINWFFGLAGGGYIDFIAKISPTFKGDYVLPPVVAEAMYSPDYFARIKGGRATVK